MKLSKLVLTLAVTALTLATAVSQAAEPREEAAATELVENAITTSPLFAQETLMRFDFNAANLRSPLGIGDNIENFLMTTGAESGIDHLVAQQLRSLMIESHSKLTYIKVLDFSGNLIAKGNPIAMPLKGKAVVEITTEYTRKHKCTRAKARSIYVQDMTPGARGDAVDIGDNKSVLSEQYCSIN